MTTTRERFIKFLGEEHLPATDKAIDAVISFIESEKAIQREEILHDATLAEIAWLKENEAPFSKKQVFDLVAKILSLLTPNHNGVNEPQK